MTQMIMYNNVEAENKDFLKKKNLEKHSKNSYSLVQYLLLLFKFYYCNKTFEGMSSGLKVHVDLISETVPI